MGEIDGAAQRVSTAGEVGAFASKNTEKPTQHRPPYRTAVCSNRRHPQRHAPTYNTRHRERTPHHDSNKTKPALPFSPDPD